MEKTYNQGLTDAYELTKLGNQAQKETNRQLGSVDLHVTKVGATVVEDQKILTQLNQDVTDQRDAVDQYQKTQADTLDLLTQLDGRLDENDQHVGEVKTNLHSIIQTIEANQELTTQQTETLKGIIDAANQDHKQQSDAVLTKIATLSSDLKALDYSTELNDVQENAKDVVENVAQTRQVVEKYEKTFDESFTKTNQNLSRTIEQVNSVIGQMGELSQQFDNVMNDLNNVKLQMKNLLPTDDDVFTPQTEKHSTPAESESAITNESQADSDDDVDLKPALSTTDDAPSSVTDSSSADDHASETTADDSKHQPKSAVDKEPK